MSPVRLMPDHARDVHDVAAVHADEAVGVEPLLDVADRERAEQLFLPVEDGGVVRVGVDRDHVLDGDELRAAVALVGR